MLRAHAEYKSSHYIREKYFDKVNKPSHLTDRVAGKKNSYSYYMLCQGHIAF